MIAEVRMTIDRRKILGMVVGVGYDPTSTSLTSSSEKLVRTFEFEWAHRQGLESYENTDST